MTDKMSKEVVEGEVVTETGLKKVDKTSLFERLFSESSNAQMHPNTSNFLQTSLGLSMDQFAIGKHMNLPAEGFDPSLFMFPSVSQITNGAGQLVTQRNSSKTLKCPKCNWHYKYQETLEIHMKEKHLDSEVACLYCLQNQSHPKLARGETYKCGFKPYRCDLCKYSTTTKGNLSIHMQSDKHLHAMQEMPQMIPQQPQMPAGGETAANRVLHCMICNTFSTDSLAQMYEHLEAERSRPCAGDIIMLNGYFHCHLCPYNTNLKANFQLHTRTDKHLQRVQLINHMREGGIELASATAMCRLSSVKSLIQVQCRACQEVLTCAANVREHCESKAHLSQIAYLSVVSGSPQKSRALAQVFGEMPLNANDLNEVKTVYECRRCSFTGSSGTEAQAHQATHLVSNCTGSAQEGNAEPSQPADLLSTIAQNDWLPGAEPLIAMKEVAFYCKECDFLSNTLEGLQNHEKAGDHSAKEPGLDEAQSSDEQCPLCIKNVPTLRQHLLEEHNIVNEVATKLMTSVSSSSSTAGASNNKSIYRHRCLRCPLIFKHKEQLVSHELTHNFRISHKCSQCPQSFLTLSSLVQHQQNEHNEELRCDLCMVNFTDRAQLSAHMASFEHLQRTKRHLEEQPQQALKLNEKILQLLQNNVSKDRPFRCNVCCQSYSQGAILDTHLRSAGHQTRMNRLNELVASGQIDAQKPVSEQPNGIPQKIIAELIDSADSDKTSNEPMTNENPLFMNMLNVAQFIQMAQQHPSINQADSSTLNALSQLSESGIDFTTLFDEKTSTKLRKRKLGVEFRRSLEGYGFELVSQFVENIQREKIDYIPDEKINELRQQFLEINRDSVPLEAIQAFAENLQKAVDAISDDSLKNSSENEETEDGDEDEASSPPEPKRLRSDSNKSSTASTPRPTASDLNQHFMATMMGLPMLGNGVASTSNPFMSPEMFQNAFATMLPAALSINDANVGDSSLNGSSPQKRARTRITDDQLKILRQYFDINNSPTEQQVKEMSAKAGLPEKVIKHWFRNTLFKERQRDKNSPYNFSVPAMMRIDLDTYEKTGEAKIIPLKQDEKKEASQTNDDFKATTSNEPELGDNRVTSPSNSSTHSSSATTNVGPLGSAADLMANFNKVMAAATGMAMFNNNPEFAVQNPFAAFFGAGNIGEEGNAFAQLLNGLNSSSIPTSAPTPVTSHSKPASITPNSNGGLSASGSSRRANRTRFTDFQLRTLQDFFDKQAYPKDDDLEMLSKKLSLSPRVIVVWFQNARQKARKIYENQPNQDNDRFIRTPGCNFQCKRCQLVFQRYYELIQHQQKFCYVGDRDAQQNDNKSLEDHLDDDERAQHQAHQQKSGDIVKLSDDETNMDDQSGRKSLAPQLNADNNNTTHNFLKLLNDVKSNGDVLMKMFKSRPVASKPKFNKRCPICSMMFNTREKLVDHLSANHSDLIASVNVDVLPNEEESETLSSTEELLGKISALTGTSPLDLSALASGNDADSRDANDRAVSSPRSQQSNDDVDNNQDDFSSTGSFDLRALSTSPHAILSVFGSPLNALNGLGNGSQLSFQHSQLQRSPAAGSGNKRYRTHLTPLQVFVMKSLFADYKTPSMTECDVLGREIGLHKRVVQVWFQNKRAYWRKHNSDVSSSGAGQQDCMGQMQYDQDQFKESKQRKCGSASIASVDEGLCSTHATGCEFCGIEFNGRTTVQDHIFTVQHINQVKERGAAIRGNNNEETMENRPARLQSTASRQRFSEDDPPVSITTEDMPFNPLNLMYSTLLDPNVVGTPISMLQIPETVMTQISSALQAGRSSIKFTQDGLDFESLSSKVDDEDLKCAKSTESEVGWACPQCSNVFQQETFLKNHQKLICTGCDGVFRLIQRHYECLPCSTKFGTQNDFKDHCEQSNHKSKRLIHRPPQLFSVLNSAASSNAGC